MYTAPERPSRRRPLLFKLFMLALVIVVIFMAVSLLRYRDMVNNAHRRVAVARLEGTITSVDGLGPWLDELRDDPYIKAVLLRIDSPGGGVTASQELFAKVKALNAKKTVIVSMGDMAASGGYYTALGASYIMANPSTIPGSIGVKMILPDFSRLMDKIGIGQNALTSGAMKDAGSPFKELLPAERAYFQDIVTDLYEQFISDVAEARRLPLDTVRGLADGRAYTGRQALALALVDGLGTFDDALGYLCATENIDVPILVEQPEPETSILQYVIERFTGSLNVRLPVSLPDGNAPVFMYIF